jgi:hypothetical protein
MDLSRFDTRELAHAGVSVPLEIDGETVYGDDGLPVTFTIRGLAAPEVHRLILQGRRTVSRTPEEVLAADLKLARAAVIGWSDNWTLEGEKVPFSKAAIDKVFSVPAIRRSVLSEVAADAHFTKKG